MSDLEVDMEVTVQHGEPRGDLDAVIVETPPFTETIAGKTKRYTDQVKVEYPGTERGAFGNLRENVHVDDIELK